MHFQHAFSLLSFPCLLMTTWAEGTQASFFLGTHSCLLELLHRILYHCSPGLCADNCMPQWKSLQREKGRIAAVA